MTKASRSAAYSTRLPGLTGMKNLLAYREAGGDVHAVSLTCTHLGCTVVWNDAERSWDCPCHRSRFSLEGKVLEGPAVEDLEKVTLED